MELFLFIIYAVLGYWAVGVVLFRNRIVVETRLGGIFITKLALGIFGGIIFIPIAVLIKIFSR